MRPNSDTGNPSCKPERADVRDVADLLGEIGHDLVQDEARRKRPPEEIGLGEAEVVVLLERADRDAGAEELPSAEQVALGVGEIEQQALLRRIARTERKLARRLLGHRHCQGGAIRGRAGILADLHVGEEAQRAHARARPVRQHAVERVAFRQDGIRAGSPDRAFASCRRC